MVDAWPAADPSATALIPVQSTHCALACRATASTVMPPAGRSESGVQPVERSILALVLDLSSIDLEEIATALADQND